MKILESTNTVLQGQGLYGHEPKPEPPRLFKPWDIWEGMGTLGSVMLREDRYLLFSLWGWDSIKFGPPLLQ